MARQMTRDDYEALIVGAGPAGLSAALVLGRCNRRVLVCDDDRPRNRASLALHGFLSRDGISPDELRRIGREQLAPYSSVQLRSVHVTSAATVHDGFELTLQDGSRANGRMLLVATGVEDELPSYQGLAPLWGRSVFHCPYCDAWELRGRRLGAQGRGEEALSHCRALLCWTSDLILFTDGPSELSEIERAGLARKGVPIVSEPIVQLLGEGPALRKVVVAGREPIPRDALFLSLARRQKSPLVEQLGCELNVKGTVDTGPFESTRVPGLFVAGDASRDVQLAIVAAAEGARAAFAINRELSRRDFSSS